MAEEELLQDSKVNHPSPKPANHSLQFVEVQCTSSGEIRRFANGTDARFALSLINRKVGKKFPLASHIEAAKEKEVPVSFGPGAILVDYGDGWKLQTVTESEGTFMPEQRKSRIPSAEGLHEETNIEDGIIKTDITMGYIGKILLAFVIMFVIGAFFTLALENLPRFLLFINSSMQ
ncbi:uncharacterized protein LOC124941727 [Impatiens glandulifera]|uniref:uncharacterized protein LOC124941727 n=1 Tax=Impatiens glandulifera TaxID=253017 RepID=UPI001FB06A05|nr:uncharacterized protein LOC124941727 [Impatiens glandulifera]